MVKKFNDLKSFRNFLIDNFSHRSEPVDEENENLKPKNWDISNIKNMSNLFEFGWCDFNKLKPINDLDVSNVENMKQMFYDCKDFNEDLSNWDVSNVKNMEQMFLKCSRFNKPLDNWKVGNSCDLEIILKLTSNTIY